MNSIKTILILSPHTDDGEFGCGATIAKYIDEGKTVYYVAFSTCEESVPRGFPKNILEFEVKKATQELGINPENLIVKNYPVRRFNEYRQEILEDLVSLRNKINPDLVFTPSSHDVHQDHSVIFKESRRAFKNTSILGYEFIWNNFSFSTTAFSVLKKEHIEKKIKSISQYRSQAKRIYAKEEMIKGAATFRGMQISEEFVEPFEVIRWIMK